MRTLLWLGFLWIGAAAALSAQRLSPPLGSRVRVSVAEKPAQSGELLAVTHDSIWLLQPQGLTSVPLRDVAELRVDRGGLGGSGAIIWSLVVGIASGTALSAACSSVADSDCSYVLPITLGAWTVVGLLSSQSLQEARYETVSPPDPDALRARARFPQGLPAGIARDSLMQHR